MIDIDNWMRELEEEEDIEIKNNEEYQTKLFEEYVLRGSDHQEERRKLNERYEAHEEEMLLGAEVLWEEKLSYYDLMEIKVSEGTASFNSELQNDPIDPESATFNPEWFDYYEPELMDFSSPEFVFVGANDPSLGKNKKSDTSSIINLALSTKTGYMYVVDASVEKRKPDVIIEDVFEMNRRLKRDCKKGFYKFGVEVVQFEEKGGSSEAANGFKMKSSGRVFSRDSMRGW